MIFRSSKSEKWQSTNYAPKMFPNINNKNTKMFNGKRVKSWIMFKRIDDDDHRMNICRLKFFFFIHYWLTRVDFFFFFLVKFSIFFAPESVSRLNYN